MKSEGEEKGLAGLRMWAVERSEPELAFLEVSFAAASWCMMGNQGVRTLPSALASSPCKPNLFGLVP